MDSFRIASFLFEVDVMVCWQRKWVKCISCYAFFIERVMNPFSVECTPFDVAAVVVEVVVFFVRFSSFVLS